MANFDGRSVKLFLVNGTPTGLITAEIINWTGHVLSGPYSRLSDLLERPEAGRSGVYCLTGDDPIDPTRQRLYVGESENIRVRMAQHERSDTKDFVERLCFVTSKDANLTKSHIKFLESRLVEMARSSKRVELDNTQTPPQSGLPESDTADMEFFLTQIAIVLPLLGFDFVRPIRTIFRPDLPIVGSKEIELVLKPERSSFAARAIYRDGDFVVLAESAAAPDKPESYNPYRHHRIALVSNGKLIQVKDGNGYKFKEDVTFTSPSAAASVILDRNSNGRVEWKLADGLQTLKEYQESLLPQLDIDLDL